MKRRNFLWCSALFMSSTVIACSRPTAPPAAEIPALKLAITDISGAEELEEKYEAFRAALAAALGTEVTFFPVENYTAATVALKRGDVDLALAGPSEYVVIKSRTNAVPIVAVTRPNYHSMIVVPASSPLSSVADLKGKTIAMSDIGSTSGHLGPTSLLLNAGLDPKTDVTVQMLGDEGSVEAIKTGKVDAWGGSAVDYADLLKDDAGSFVVLVEGPPLPSDVIIASSNLDPAAIELIRERLLAQEGAIVSEIATHVSKYVGSTMQPALDADYDPIRTVYQAIGQGEFVQ
ncbi:MAG TPA: phosphate/phosphite/phosphonate ABC transporter substrate-binding protein [Trichocoleus sp.]